MIFIKNLLRFYFDIFRDFFVNRRSSLFFLLRCSKLRRPLHIQGLKYIKINGRVTIMKQAGIDCYSTNDCKPNIVFGNNVLIGNYFTMLVTTDCTIDDNALIASNVFISTENHGMNPLIGPYMKQELLSKPVHICKNVWIGEKVCILPGVTIGENSIIGSGSVVTKSIPANSIACGNPCKVIKKFDFDTNKWVKVNYDK